LIRFLAEPKPLPFGQPTAVLSATHTVEALMVKAGEAILQAGPLTKGVGICHGTDGNGYALLKLYSRTGDLKWLSRARAFAMHAIEQNVNEHSLWEGDLGLACYLHACLVVDHRFPLLDVY